MMDGLKHSKLAKPSGLKPPQIRTVKLEAVSENILKCSSGSVPILSKKLPRRSKSATDLRLIDNQLNKPSNMANKIQPTRPIKRKADKTTDEVKNKILKQTRIPDWDYKGRYNQLKEKYTSLNVEYKTLCHKLEGTKTIEEKYNSIKREYDEVVRNLEQTKIKNKVLSDENVNFHEENKLLSSNISALKKDYYDLREKFETLNISHNNLKINYNKKLNENEKLNFDLKQETKKNIDLIEQNARLKKDIYTGEILRRKLHNTVQDLKGNIRVFCRVRPTVSSAEEEQPQCVINFLDEKTIEIRKSRESINTVSGKPTDIKAEFNFEKVFQPACSQEQIFEDLSQLIQSAFDGYDICVFAYGQTGSGKTYTMQGEENGERKGMIPRTVDLIFKRIEELRTTGWNYAISASFLEIYNENVRDLLNPNPTQNLEIRYNEGRGTTVTNLSMQKLNSAMELNHLIDIARKNRAVAATDFNEHSSRSHAVTKIYLHGSNMEVNEQFTGSINLVDLAGSESAKTRSNERLVETKNINKSLAALGNVMLALHNKEKHIPYRNSKLTYLLQSCLGGNSKTLMVVNIAPFEECYTESINSLRFAAKVKEVKTNAKRNKNVV